MKPLHGITFCPTGFQSETTSNEIAKIIFKLGGQFTKDLTRYVNALILGEKSDTPKYRFAVMSRPDMLFLDYTTIYELYQRWMAGDDITLKSHSKFAMFKNDDRIRMLAVLRTKLQSKPLNNYYIFIGRVSEPTHDKNSKNPFSSSSSGSLVPRLEAICNELGCYKCNTVHFVKDTKKNNPKKHVIFISDTLSGARVNAALEVGVPVVHYKWILDCRRRYAALQYDPYYLVSSVGSTSYDLIGAEACQCWESVLEFDDLDALLGSTPSGVAPGKESQFPTPSNDPDGIGQRSIAAMLHKFKPQGDKLWKKALLLNRDKDDEMVKGNKDSNNNDDRNVATREEPLASATNSFSNKKIDVTESDQGRINTKKIFADCIFKIHSSFPPQHLKILQKVIKENDGTIYENYRSMPTSIPSPTLYYPHKYYILPSDIPMDDLQLSNENHFILATEFFIERCLHYSKLLDPLDSWSKPFFHTARFNIIPSPALLHHNDTSLHISITGFYGVELLHLTKILRILEPMGITFSEYLNSKTDILLINIASLTSIPQTHTLWQNEFGDMFQENYITETRDLDNEMHDPQKHPNVKRSSVFRNSMKRKIQFVKNIHCIPALTPAFLMNIFKSTEAVRLATSPTIYLNNVKWCILCPKGKRSDFECKILSTSTDTSSHDQGSRVNDVVTNSDVVRKLTGASNTDSKPMPSTVPTSLAKSARDLIDTMRNVSSNVQPQPVRKRVLSTSSAPPSIGDDPPMGKSQKYESAVTPRSALRRPKHKESSAESALSDTELSHFFRRPRLTNRKVKLVARSSSWGTIISDEMTNMSSSAGAPSFGVSKTSDVYASGRSGISNLEPGHTQVTYGTRRDMGSKR